MPRFYIANTTRQHHQFLWRRPESSVYTAPILIPSGTQTEIGNDLSDLEISSILNQHTRYGLVAADKVGKTKAFVGLAYSIGKPVNMAALENAFEHNREVLTETARENRQRTAIEIGQSIPKTLSDRGIEANIPRVEVEVTEDTRPDVKSTIAEGIEILRPNTRSRHKARAIEQ